jgi:putative aminopeptidase FrvX
VFSTQEEVGLRGARTAAYAVDPHIGIAIDVTGTGDTPKGSKMEVSLGKGPAIKIKDGGMLADRDVIALMEAAAERAKVPYQREVLIAGTTDASSMQLSRAGQGGLPECAVPLHPHHQRDSQSARCRKWRETAGGAAQRTGRDITGPQALIYRVHSPMIRAGVFTST